jgi:Uncharacterized protein conserved in bacteria (DUF2252)
MAAGEGMMRNIRKSVRTYDRWLADKVTIEKDDLERKHALLRESPFLFLRGTFFRWAERIEEIAAPVAHADTVAAIGDIHIDNYGAWRDDEGRISWGVNDFDEAVHTPFTFDLIRLGASALLARKARLPKANDIAAAILDGYTAHLGAPKPFVLDEQNVWMRARVLVTTARRIKFWAAIDALPDIDPPGSVQARLRAALPEKAVIERFARRTAGVGSLGRPRFVVIAAWRGGRIVREAKARLPSAWHLSHPKTNKLDLPAMIHGPYRPVDPHFIISTHWVIRRLAPDSRKLDRVSSGGSPDLRMLRAMGADLANLHVASCDPRRLERTLAGLPLDWLRKTMKAAALEVIADYKDWARTGP